MTEESTPHEFDVAVASSLAGRVQLRDIVFASTEGRLLEGAAVGGGTLAFDMPVADVRWFRHGVELKVVVPYQLNITTKKDESTEVPVAEIRVLMRVDYELASLVEVTDDDVHHFVGISAFMHSWPYLRAEVMELTTKLRLPPLVLPVVLSGHAPEYVTVSKLQFEPQLAVSTAMHSAPPVVASETLKHQG